MFPLSFLSKHEIPSQMMSGWLGRSLSFKPGWLLLFIYLTSLLLWDCLL